MRLEQWPVAMRLPEDHPAWGRGREGLQRREICPVLRKQWLSSQATEWGGTGNEVCQGNKGTKLGEETRRNLICLEFRVPEERKH